VHKVTVSGSKGTLTCDGSKVTYYGVSSSSTDIPTEIIEDDANHVEPDSTLKDAWGFGIYYRKYLLTNI
jgi:hypothetical protein